MPDGLSFSCHTVVGAECRDNQPPLGPIVDEESPETLLWGMLDNIDTLSDMIKPRDLTGYRKFYNMAMKEAEKRHNILTSDGYALYRKTDDA